MINIDLKCPRRNKILFKSNFCNLKPIFVAHISKIIFSVFLLKTCTRKYFPRRTCLQLSSIRQTINTQQVVPSRGIPRNERAVREGGPLRLVVETSPSPSPSPSASLPVLLGPGRAFFGGFLWGARFIDPRRVPALRQGLSTWTWSVKNGTGWEAPLRCPRSNGLLLLSCSLSRPQFSPHFCPSPTHPSSCFVFVAGTQ